MCTRAEALAQRGHAVSVVTPRLGRTDSLLQLCPYEDECHGGYSARMQVFALLRHYRLIRDCDADAFHIHYAASIGAWLFVISGRLEPIVVTAMGGDVLDDEQVPLPWIARWMTQQVLKRADLVTVKSDYMLAVLKRRGIPQERLLKVVWGVNLKHFKPCVVNSIRKKLNISPDRRIILSPRILRPFYNIRQIIEAMPRILKRIPEACLVVTELDADPDHRRELADRIRDLGIEDAICWGGHIPHDKMPDMFGLAEVVVSIPPSDGFPQSVFEAFACGTPCIVSNLDRYKEFLTDGENALFIEPVPAAIADACLRILQNGELATKLRSNGLATVKEIADINRETARFDKALRHLVAGTSKGPAALWVRIACIAVLAGLVIRSGFRAIFPQSGNN